MTREFAAGDQKPLVWAGSSLKDWKQFPSDVQRHMGYALSAAQFGGKHDDAKPWKGDGPGMMEIVEDYRGDTFRAVYTVRFERAVYVLHAFQKKSKRGIKTSKADQDLVASRLQRAQRDYEELYGKDR